MRNKTVDSWHITKPSGGSVVEQLSTSEEFNLLVGGSNIFASNPADIWERAESGDIDFFGESDCE